MTDNAAPDNAVPCNDTAGADAPAAWSAAQTGAALFDLPGRSHLELAGADRAAFLHNFCTNDVRGLAAGMGREAFITNVQGKVLAHVFVFAEPDVLWIEASPGLAEKIVAHLSRYQIREQVTFTDRTGELSTMYLAGPAAARMLQECGIESPSASLGCAQKRGLELSEHTTTAWKPSAPKFQTPFLGKAASLTLVRATFPQGSVQIRRNDFVCVPGYVLVAEPAAIAALRELLLKSGAIFGEKAAFESLRIEAGFPEYGVDVTEANLAQEVNRTSQAICFTKGCYLGQEPIARIDALGHVNQQLRVLRLGEGGALAAVGAEVVAGVTDARPAGRVTSAAVAGDTGLPIALAYVRRGYDAPGTTVAVRIGERLVPATVSWPEGQSTG